jgi:hypothetical protein
VEVEALPMASLPKEPVAGLVKLVEVPAEELARDFEPVEDLPKAAAAKAAAVAAAVSAAATAVMAAVVAAAVVAAAAAPEHL